MWDELAIRWYNAEKDPSHVQWQVLPERRKEEIRRRVKLVLEGEVRRSECSPGDLVVWLGRFRSPLRPPDPANWPGADRDDTPSGRPRMRRWAWYDSLELGPKLVTSQRLFNGHNVGYLDRSNLQLAGQLSPDGFHIQLVWLTLAVDEDREKPLLDLLTSGMVIYCIGDHPAFQMKAYDLWKDPHPVDLFVPTRQHFNVEIDFYRSEGPKKGLDWVHYDSSLERWKKALRGSDPERPYPRLYVYVEGWERRKVM